jgi:hypothetical protein
MKRKLIFFAMLAFIFVLAGCSNGGNPGAGDGVITVGTFTGTKSGIDYSLTLSRVNSRAVADVAVNDDYELILKKPGSVQKSSGKVTSVSSGVLTLQSSYRNAPSFKVTVSGVNITNATGTITFDSGETTQGPGAITPSDINLAGTTWIGEFEYVGQGNESLGILQKGTTTFTFAASTVTVVHNLTKPKVETEGPFTIPYTVNGNTFTIEGFSFEIVGGNTFEMPVEDNPTYRYTMYKQ